MENSKIRDAQNRIEFLRKVMTEEQSIMGEYVIGFLQTIAAGLDGVEIQKADHIAGSPQEMRSALL